MMIEQPDPSVTKLILDSVAMEKDRNRWRRALNDCTPGGSEFANDPEYCVEWVKNARNNMWETAKKNIIANRKLREALEDAMKTLRLVRNGAEGKEIQTLARDVVNKLEELNVGSAKQSESTRPGEPLNSIARQERV
jgi:hypothetical protein